MSRYREHATLRFFHHASSLIHLYLCVRCSAAVSTRRPPPHGRRPLPTDGMWRPGATENPPRRPPAADAGSCHTTTGRRRPPGTRQPTGPDRCIANTGCLRQPPHGRRLSPTNGVRLHTRHCGPPPPGHRQSPTGTIRPGQPPATAIRPPGVADQRHPLTLSPTSATRSSQRHPVINCRRPTPPGHQLSPTSAIRS